MLQTLNKKQVHKVAIATTYKLGSDYYKVVNLQQKQAQKLTAATPKSNCYKP
jgi:hypothetical protein